MDTYIYMQRERDKAVFCAHRKRGAGEVLWGSHQHTDGFLKDSENLEIWVGGSVEQHADGMQDGQGSKVQCIVTLPRQVHVDLVEDAVAKIRLLI